MVTPLTGQPTGGAPPARTDAAGSLLINAVTWGAVGHTIVALRAADGLRAMNPRLRIGMAVRRAHAELPACVPAVDLVYPVDVALRPDGTPGDGALEGIPRDWDYVYGPFEREYPSAELSAFQAAFRAHVRAGRHRGADLKDGFPPSRARPLRLRLPGPARTVAAGFLRGEPPRVALIFGSATGNGSRTPPLDFWRRLIAALLETSPAAEVVLLGRTLRDGRGVTKGVSREAVDACTRSSPRVRDAYDRPILEQLAIAERCAALVAPHTGFAFAVQAVGVPWVALSGCEFHEYVLNGVPLVPLYPACPAYPCAGRMLPECRRLSQGPLTTALPCMSSRELVPRIPLVLDAVRGLVDGTRAYHECAAAHLSWLARERGLGVRDGGRVLQPDYVFEKE